MSNGRGAGVYRTVDAGRAGALSGSGAMMMRDMLVETLGGCTPPTAPTMRGASMQKPNAVRVDTGRTRSGSRSSER